MGAGMCNALGKRLNINHQKHRHTITTKKKKKSEPTYIDSLISLIVLSGFIRVCNKNRPLFDQVCLSETTTQTPKKQQGFW